MRKMLNDEEGQKSDDVELEWKSKLMRSGYSRKREELKKKKMLTYTWGFANILESSDSEFKKIKKRISLKWGRNMSFHLEKLISEPNDL
uniref:Ovule protein n=1 Tax=Caenorhabditis tropicalis TaxID=1561998 RepID=A0A1I7UUK2_9PELO